MGYSQPASPTAFVSNPTYPPSRRSLYDSSAMLDVPAAGAPLRPPAVAGSAKIPMQVARTTATISFFMPLSPFSHSSDPPYGADAIPWIGYRPMKQQT